MKICVIGNSHSICITKAWGIMSESYPDVSLKIFASTGNYFGKITVDKKNNLLTMPSERIRIRLSAPPGRDGEIDFSKFDICLVVGGMGQTSVSHMAQLGGQAKAGFSKQAISASIVELCAASHANILFQKIREISDILVFHFQTPILADKKETRLDQMSHPFHPYDYDLGLQMINDTVMNPKGMTLLPQPPETLAAEHKTKYELCVGTRKPFKAEIAAGFKGEFQLDHGHMKPEFGRIRLEALFQHLGVAPQSVAQTSLKAP